MGNLTDEQTPLDEIGYTYDAAHPLLSMTVNGQTPISYTYDTLDRLIAMTQGNTSASFVYDSAGRQTQVTLPNGVVENLAYDGLSRIAGLTWSGAQSSIGDLEYADALGRVIEKTGSLAQISLPQAESGNTFNAANQMVSFGGTTVGGLTVGNIQLT